MIRNTIETVMGAVVLIIAGAFLWLAYSATNIQASGGMVISAEFGGIGGLNVGDDVQLSGIKVGKVISTELNPETFRASVVFSIDERVRLPVDSAVRVASSSLLGGNHLEILPGFEDEVIETGGVVYDTRDPVNLTDLLGKAVFSGGAGGASGG